MARSQSPGDLKEYWQEIEDIKSSKKHHDDDDDDISKTPDEGELEAAWLKDAGYDVLVHKFQAGKELSEDEVHAITESLPESHVNVVRRRVETLNATLRKKQKYTTKIDVRNIFPEQRPSSTTIIQSQPVGEDTLDTKQPAKRPSTLPRGLKLAQNGESNSWIKKQHHKANNSPKISIHLHDLCKGHSQGQSHSQGQGHSSKHSSDPFHHTDHSNDDIAFGQKDYCREHKGLNTSADSVLDHSYCPKCQSLQCEGHLHHASKGHLRSFMKYGLDSPKLSKSSSCDTLDSIDSGLESSGSLINRENSSSHDSLIENNEDGPRCFPKVGPFKYKFSPSSPLSSPRSPRFGFPPLVDYSNAQQVESPCSTDEDPNLTLVGYRKRQHSVTELPKSPTSPRGEVVHPEWNLNRNRSSKGRGSFMKNKGGYSMSGTREEVQDNLEMGVEMLSMQQKGRQDRMSTGSELSPISDADITFDFQIDESNGDDVLNERSQSQTNLPKLLLYEDKLGQTSIDGISSEDVNYVRKLALLEITSLFDTYNISYSRRRSKRKQKESGIFGVALTTLMEQDVKLQANCLIPLVFQEMVSYVSRTCLESEGILRIPGSTSRVKQLRQEMEERFYQGTFIWSDDLTPNDVGTLMKQFLRELPVPLLTDEYIEAFAQVEYLPDKKSQLHALNLLILLLPDVHRNTLCVLLELLELIILNSNTNKMTLNNVAMIMAPNLFMAPKVGNKSKNTSWELEMKMAANTSNIMKMLIHYRNVLWTVPSSVMNLVRRQYEIEQIRKNRDKSKMKGLLSKKDKTEVYKKPALIHETDFQAGVIRVQAPNLTKSSTAIQLDNHMTAGDIVSKFRVIQDTDTTDSNNSRIKNSNHSQISVDHRNFQSAGDDTFLYEVGGNIGERCLPHNTNMLCLYNVNPNAEWIIKRRERFKVT